MSAWNKNLMCIWRQISASQQENSVTICLPEGNCCDMRGAIKIAEFLLPGVTTIQTVAGKKYDTMYQKHDSGRWEVFDVKNKEYA